MARNRKQKTRNEKQSAGTSVPCCDGHRRCSRAPPAALKSVCRLGTARAPPVATTTTGTNKKKNRTHPIETKRVARINRNDASSRIKTLVPLSLLATAATQKQQRQILLLLPAGPVVATPEAAATKNGHRCTEETEPTIASTNTTRAATPPPPGQKEGRSNRNGRRNQRLSKTRPPETVLQANMHHHPREKNCSTTTMIRW
mmetsp:Transcript_1690/g.3776  ORF Transcript_1690/g.3776 Transcript_1690/m.3776 type:complete len:201 (+) Transcript_1690:921-1523(+)